MFAWLRQGWQQLVVACGVLLQARFSLLVVLLSGYALYTNDQAQDLLAGIGEDKLKITFFVLAVCWCAIQGWGWARYIYNRVYPKGHDAPGLAGFLVRHVPRVCGVGAFVLAAFAARSANAPRLLVIAFCVLGVVAYGCFMMRGKLHRAPWLVRLFSARVLMLISYMVMFSSGVIAIVWPVAMGDMLGAGAVVFIALGCLVPVGTWLVDRARAYGFPVLTALLMLAVLFSATNDNHAVRSLGNDAAADLSLDQAFDAYHKSISRAPSPVPVILVATAGGGLRASYWTAVVLSELEQVIPDFHRHVFAISGVSGGSVGAVFYNAALAAGVDSEQLQRRLLQAIGRDYLAPTVAGMLYGDLMQRMLPIAMLPDRAAALEKAWEQGFTAAFPSASCGLRREFRSFWNDDACGVDLNADPLRGPDDWLPLLLINGTYEETGRRIITAPVGIDPAVFLDADDFYSRNAWRAIPASTAAHNGARFTYVSPAGTFTDNAPVPNKGHVIDGGYFENYGAETLRDLLRWIRHHPQGRLGHSRLVVLVISNDIDMPRARFDQEALRPQPASRFLNEVLAPLNGLFNTRNARGMLAVKALRAEVEDYCSGQTTCWDPVFALFHLERSGESDPPLGWVLSQGSMQTMRNQIKSGANSTELQRVMAAFERQ
jgi:hypothetical protein